MSRYYGVILFVGLMALWAVAPRAQQDVHKDLFEIDDEETGTDASPQASAELIPEAMVRSLEGPIDPDEYVLGPLDELFLVLRGPDTKLQHLRILPEGNVILPNIGAFAAAGLTLTEFRDEVRKALQKYYRNIDIDCQLARPRTFVVYVIGEVGKPGPVQLVAPFRLSRAISAGGGVSAKGSLREIEIREKGEMVRKVDLFSFLRFGDLDQNPMLREGQNVYVPPRQSQVWVQGEVHLPGAYEIVAGETAADAIRYAGGITTLGDREQIMFERTRGPLIEKGRSFSESEAEQVAVRDLDVIVVRDVRTYDGSQPVRVVGGGGRNGTMYIEDDVTLHDFVNRLGRLTPQFDVDRAIVERRTGGYSPELIPFDARAVMAGDSIGNMPLRPGDIIYFPSIEGQVYVAGEVMVPGPITYQPGMRAERYVALAGGPNEGGSFNKLKILATDGSERDADRDSPVYRGETIVVGRRTSKTFGALFVGFTSLTSLILSVIAVSK